jgi:hypothetical protein
MEDITQKPDPRFRMVLLNVYCIALKRNVNGKVKSGQGYYDYDEGLMSFFAPGQVVASVPDIHQLEGWCVTFHPDFLRGYSLARKSRYIISSLVPLMKRCSFLKKSKQP